MLQNDYHINVAATEVTEKKLSMSFTDSAYGIRWNALMPLIGVSEDLNRILSPQ